MDNTLLKKRREGVFGLAVLLAGLAMFSLVLVRTAIGNSAPERLLPTLQQERFFFDLLGIVCGCWLLSWVSAINQWKQWARVGQWLGIILLCLEEVILAAVWHDAQGVLSYSPHVGIWLSPLVIQTYLMGCFFGFFTLPSLTFNGNLRLTGLGTLALLLPWLCGRDAVISGAECLHGLLF